MTLPIHPAANEFPILSGDRFTDLKQDIATHGQRETIKLYKGQVLDGRNRLAACEVLGITPSTEALPDDLDPWAYVWSLNGERRDLVAEQRYLIWKECHEKSTAFRDKQSEIKAEANAKRSAAAKEQHAVSNPRKGERFGSRTECPTTKEEPGKDQKAEASKTNRGAVARGDKLATHRPDLAEQVRKGKMKPAEAHRQMKKAEVAEKAKALPDGQYRVIYADPPWKYGDGRSGDNTTATGALHHYPTMTMSELKALDVSGLAAPDSVLFLWSTSPLLPEGLDLAAAWGFKYKACFVWDKVGHNLGHYNSVRHEFLLVCTRGAATPDVSKLYDSVQVIEKTAKHSQKPSEFRNIIDTLYPNGPRVELFARESTKGWDAWGNEAPAL